MNEIFKDVTGYEGLYEVSNLGNVYAKERIVKTSLGRLRRFPKKFKDPQYVPNSSYRYVTLYKNNKSKSYNICELVAAAFMEGYVYGTPLYHIDQDVNNDCINNLSIVVPPILNKYQGLDDFEILEGEIFVPIKGYEDLYEISNKGRLKILAKYVRGKNDRWIYKKCTISSHVYSKEEYYMFTLYDKFQNLRYVSVHRLVADHFIPNPKNLPYINHIDGDKKNNDVSNLEWCNAKYNATHAAGLGLLNWSVTNRSHESPVICLTDGKEFKSIAAASRYYNVSYNRLQQNICHGSGKLGDLCFKYLYK